MDTEAKNYRIGTHRHVTPADTIARVRPHMKQMGITRVANVTGLDRIGVPVVTVCRPNARSLAVSQGKGCDLEAAIASGLMEASELYHAEHIENPLKLGNVYQLLRSHNLVNTQKLPKIAGSKFDQFLQMLWIEGRNLFDNEPIWVPFECVGTDFTVPNLPGNGCFDCSSNGLASGNTIKEAICHGICEVVERDATTLWNVLSPSKRAAMVLDLNTVNDHYCREVLGQFARAEFEVTVWEITSDLGVPCFFCVVQDLFDSASHLGVGAGAHPAPQIALLRALTEAAQVRTTYISGARDDLSWNEYGHRYQRDRNNIAKWLHSHSAPCRDFEKIADYSSMSFSRDLDWLLSRLSNAGIDQAVAIDLTRSDIGLPVVRVVIPGLEGPDDHNRYVPGERARRLFGPQA